MTVHSGVNNVSLAFVTLGLNNNTVGMMRIMLMSLAVPLPNRCKVCFSFCLFC